MYRTLIHATLLVVVGALLMSTARLLISSSSQLLLYSVSELDRPVVVLWGSGSGGGASGEVDTTTTTAVVDDPPDDGRVDCRQWLREYRNHTIEEMERKVGWSKSYVTRTTTPKPFYWSTHHPQLDHIRSSSFEQGQYYEKQLSQRIMEIFEEKMTLSEDDPIKNSIFLDVGGNIGWFSLLAAAHGATTIYTFEPNPANVVRICESVSLNQWLPPSPAPRDHRDREDVELTFVTIPKGVGNVSGIQQLYRVDEKNPGSFTFAADNAWVKKRRAIAKSTKDKTRAVVGDIEMVTLDDFAHMQGWFTTQPSIGFFKLDVEGYEVQIIDGAKQLFNSRLIEWFAMEMKANKAPLEIYQILEIVFYAGYDLYMHGTWSGPSKRVEKNYTTPLELGQDIIAKKYGENLLFQRREKRQQQQ